VVSILIPRSTHDNASPGLPDDQHGANDMAILRVRNETCCPTPAKQARAVRIAAQIAETAQAGFILPGTLTEPMTRCGYPRCRCHADAPLLHGPYHQWTRKIKARPLPGS
jgi:hypothetical protein